MTARLTAMPIDEDSSVSIGNTPSVKEIASAADALGFAISMHPLQRFVGAALTPRE
ncbi:hypothetical protein [Pseudomonas huanghezhanensis]|uniref:hypothetical protein n=1 Tax=Pseudomonas huanghezhanensis TaxID=3002903 RepID=UPI00228637E2|nr:hypothetical protein [Pseudomonas sp. BSw22131]